MTKLSYHVSGLDCAEEVKLIRHALDPHLHEDDDLAFDLLKGRLTVSCASGLCESPKIERAIADTGMTATPWDQAQQSDGKKNAADKTRGGLCLTSLATLVGAVAADAVQRGPLTAFGHGESEAAASIPVLALYTVAIATGLWPILPKAWFALRNVRPDINLLVVIAAIGAAVLGQWFEAAAVSFLFAVAILLEAWSVGRARRAIESLVDLAPATARVLCSHGESEKSVAEVKVGARIRILPGDRVPLDGEIATGSSSINEAPITGESVPKSKAPGDEVFAGSINNEGALEVTVTRAADDTTLARIIRMVEEAQGRRAPAERWVDQFALYYTPIMMAIAVAFGLLAIPIQGATFGDAVYLTLVILLIACPCALVISTPVSIVAGLAHAARKGVLIKGGAFLEAPARLKAIAFDKTGTLTEGKPKVTKVVSLGEKSESDILAIAAAIESQSTHPLAQAVVAYAKEKGTSIPSVVDCKTVEGKGAEGTVDGVRYWIGNHRIAKDNQVDEATLQDSLSTLENEGATAVTLGTGPQVIGLIALADAARDVSRIVISDLKAMGIAHTVMLTGDNPRTAKAVAESVGIDAFEAGLLPQDKTDHIKALTEKYGQVAMVGDGINDAPAMAASSLAIAMGAAGSDTAIETADIALMSDDLTRIPWLVNHSKRTLGVIRQNVVIALGLKVAVLILAICGIATLWLAILADMGASLLVIFNALRLLK